MHWKLRKLKNAYEKAYDKGRYSKAIEYLDLLIQNDPKEAKWSHKKGDVLRKMKKDEEAVLAYSKAVDIYAQQGFVTRAVAMAKVAMSIDPKRADILEKVDPGEARRLRDAAKHRQSVPTNPKTQELRTAAPELTVAQDQGADETRFGDDGTMNIEIPVDMVAAVRGGQLPNADPIAREPQQAGNLAKLPSMALFADVSQKALDMVVREAELLEAEPGQPVMRIGEPSDSVVVIVDGEVDITDAKGKALAVLGEGDVFGESALIESRPRRANAVAKTDLIALKIRKEVLDRLTRAHPKVGDVIFEVLTQRVIANVIGRIEMFRVLRDASKQKLARLFEVRRARQGMTLIKAGKRGDGFYVLLSGEIELSNPDGRMERVGAGHTAGLRSLYGETPSDYTVTVVSDALVLRLPAAKFKKVVETRHSDVSALREYSLKPPPANQPPEHQT